MQADRDRSERLAGAIVIFIGLLFPCAYFAMLAIGVLHSKLPAVPTFGYWETVLMLLGLRGAIAIAIGLRGTQRSKNEVAKS